MVNVSNVKNNIFTKTIQYFTCKMFCYIIASKYFGGHYEKRPYNKKSSFHGNGFA